MKNFLKRNIILLVLFFVSIVLLLLGSLSVVFLILSCTVFGITFLIVAIRTRKKYKEIKDYSYEDDIIDMTKYDYDEEVYFVGDMTKRKKEVGKTMIKRLTFSAPVIALYMLSIGFFTMALMSGLRLLF